MYDINVSGKALFIAKYVPRATLKSMVPEIGSCQRQKMFSSNTIYQGGERSVICG